MPCMYTARAQLPLTPPYLTQFTACPPHAQSYSQSIPVAEKGVYEINVDPYGRKLMPSFVRVSHGYQQLPPPPPPPPSFIGLPPPGITHPSSQYYRRAEQQQSAVDEGFHRLPIQPEPHQPSTQPPVVSEEKPIGGVAVHLDYEMEEMTEFVGTVAQRLVVGHASSDRLMPSYRKFVSQILSSTRLPSSTILLGLVYVRERSAMPQMAGARQEHVYRLLTIALLLASKFLDDNTFQNKSWSEVTGIPVQELNLLEKEWLRDIKWNLHVDPEGTKGYRQYKTMWDVWVKRNAIKPTSTLAPIETNFRPRIHGKFSPTPLYPPHHQQLYTPPASGIISDRPLHLPPPVRPSQPSEGYYRWNPEHSPPSAPETGPTTPEGFGCWTYTQNSTQPQPAYSRLPPLIPYPQRGWHTLLHQHSACNCAQCPQNREGYFPPHNYGTPIAA